MIKNFTTLGFILVVLGLNAQDMDSLMQTLSNDSEREVVSSTFKSPKLVLLQTNETQSENTLTVWIGHRFGEVSGESGGVRNLFGLDHATDIHLGLDYGFTEDLTVGIGRSRFDQSYNLQAKYRLLQQMEQGMPVSVSLFAQSSWITRKEYFANEFPEEADRISHFLQAIVARKFSPDFSLMLNPGYLFRPQARVTGDKEDFFVLGIGGRLKFTNRLSLIADYTLVNGFDRPGDLEVQHFNPLGIGLEIETGGHVFSLNFQNSTYITANNFIPHTQRSWRDDGVRFGFSITRDFYVGPKKDRVDRAY